MPDSGVPGHMHRWTVVLPEMHKAFVPSLWDLKHAYAGHSANASLEAVHMPLQVRRPCRYIAAAAAPSAAAPHGR